MKELREILSKTSRGDISEEALATLPLAADDASTVCEICGGAGFVRRDLPWDHPDFGKAQPCVCVLDEADDARRSRLERISNLGTLTRFRFDNLVAGGRDGGSAWFPTAFEAGRAFAANPRGWLVLSGPSGSGKTHLAAAIANECIEQGRPALFMVVPDFLDHLRASYDASIEELGYDQLFDQVRNAPLLILDDLDAAAGTDWTREKLFQVVNHRYNATLPTVFTCTARPQQLDERLATRLCDEALSRVLLLEGTARSGYQQVGGMSRDRLAEMQFRTFDLRGSGLRPEQRDTLEAAFRMSVAFADDPRGWLILQGANGCGKTHLAAAIANKLLAGGTGVFFAVVPDLLDHLRASFAPGKEVGYDELFEQIRNAEVLILDDLGAQATSPWAQEKLYQIVNFRTVAGLATVVTTDQPDEVLREAHPRIYSRIADPAAGVEMRILAPHYRLGHAPAGDSRPTRRR